MYPELCNYFVSCYANDYVIKSFVTLYITDYEFCLINFFYKRNILIFFNLFLLKWYLIKFKFKERCINNSLFIFANNFCAFLSNILNYYYFVQIQIF